MRPWLCSNDHPREAGGTSVTHIANAHRTTIAWPTKLPTFLLYSTVPVAQSAAVSLNLVWVMPIVIITFSVSIGGVVLALASLGFLGYGLPPGIPDWGGLLSREGRQYMEIAPRLAFGPGLCLTITVFSLNMFGDAVRDLLDPRLRGAGS